MVLLATVATILNMVGAVVALPAWVRAVAIVLNVVFVVAGVAIGEMLVWAPHLALIPLNAALLVGAVSGRSA